MKQVTKSQAVTLWKKGVIIYWSRKARAFANRRDAWRTTTDPRQHDGRADIFAVMP